MKMECCCFAGRYDDIQNSNAIIFDYYLMMIASNGHRIKFAGLATIAA